MSLMSNAKTTGLIFSYLEEVKQPHLDSANLQSLNYSIITVWFSNIKNQQNACMPWDNFDSKYQSCICSYAKYCVINIILSSLYYQN